MKRPVRQSGFSLIELLTVIAIIAILAAIIFPVMASVKERARRQQCMSNLHQIAIGVQMFKRDNRYYPRILGSEAYTEPPASGGARQKWVVAGGVPDLFENVKDNYLFAEYVPTIQGFHCPSARTTNSRDVAVYDSSTSGGNLIAVYAYNSYDCFITGAGQASTGFTIYREQNGEVEPHYVLNWAADVNAVGSLAPYPPGKVTDTVAIRQQDYARQLRFRNPPGDTVITWCSYHEGNERGGRSLVLFLDGHVDSIPAQEMVQCKWRVRPKKG